MAIHQRSGFIALALSACLTLAACGGDSSDADDIKAPKTAAGDITCKASKVGPFTRCDNFFEDFWPTIDKNIQDLYADAKATDGGQLVIWDWYELSPDVIKKFNESFPDIKVKTRGLTYNLPSAVISAKTTGERNTDILSGSITSMTSMYDEGYWEKIDWTKYGVPKEFFETGAPELLPDSFNGGLLNYDSSKVDDVPTSLSDFAKPEWKGKVAVANYNAQQFAGFGMKNGKDAMVDLITELKANGSFAVVEDTGQLLSSGEKPVVLSGQLFNPKPELKVAPFEEVALYAQFSGVNSDAKNKPAAILWALWNAYNPDWLEARMTDEKFATSAMPYPGLPDSVFSQASGLAKTNDSAWLSALDQDWGVVETQDTRDKWNDMIAAADKALN